MASETRHPVEVAKSKGTTARGVNGRYLVFIFLATALLNGLLMPDRLMPGDPKTWIAEATSIATHGELAVAKEYEDFGAPGQYVLRNPSNGRFYSKYGIASSLLVLPPVALNCATHGDDRQLLVFLNIWYAIGSGVLATLLVWLAGQFTMSRSAPLMFVLICFYATFAWFYLRAQTMELPLMILFTVWFAAAVAILQKGGGRWVHLALWLSAAVMVLTRPFYLPLLPFSAAVAAWPVRGNSRALRLSLAYAALIACTIVCLLAWSNHVKFGAWYLTGYHQWFPEAHTLQAGRVWRCIYFITDLHNSILLTFPAFTLSLIAIPRFWQCHRMVYLLAIAVFAVFMLLVSATDNWSGAASEGPRYLLPFLPAISLPLVLLIDRIASTPLRMRRYAATLVLCLIVGVSSFNWYQIVARPMLTWMVLTSDPFVPQGTKLGAWVKLPRGLFLWSLYAYGDRLDEHPYMRCLAAQLTPAHYRQYRTVARGFLMPNNWYLFHR